MPKIGCGEGSFRVRREYLFAMRLLRRLAGALAMAGIAAAGLRVRGRGGTPPQHGGWRPLELPDDAETR